ncbi:PAS domain S-box protein [Azoarcus sp. L1K30]|uniref:PAS domain-containing sensor histidine kinase n=1 Tax=Azoarcus sp. L1K30 TaxID=2820277 RepID=UPI001B844AD3|nr:ATP-binding protein [Azoarcus sp. L1K30]MBR0565662.1 PAS domain S-box protein [Azoarcus sp. L1K30]
MTHELSDDLLQVFNASVDAMLIADTSGGIRRANLALARLFGLAQPLPPGLTVNDLIPERLRALHARHTAAYARNPEARPMNIGRLLHARRADGSEFPAEVSLSPLPGGRVLATVHDASARIEAEARTRQWAQRYASLLGAIPDIVVEMDREHVLTWGNAAAYHFFGDHFVGQPIARFHTEHQSIPDMCAEYEAWFSRSDGQRRLLSWCCHRLTNEGRTSGHCLCSARDMTERHRDADALRALRIQMRHLHALQIAGQTARKIAHDLNQPLNAVSAYATAALRLLGDGQDEHTRLREALEGCSEEADRAGAVMHELMNFLERDGLKPAPVDLPLAIHNVVKLCHDDGYRDTRFDVDIAPDLWPIVGDQRQIESVVHSLITNSVEALRIAGVDLPSIRVEARNDIAHQAVQISLSDNGPGLDAQVAAQAFSPFFTTKRQAMGLGLTISRALVEAAGGELWYDPEAGPGATFRFTVPIEAPT